MNNEDNNGCVKKAVKLSLETDEQQGLTLDFSQTGILQGFLFSQILGKPKSMQKGRWNRWN